jgi:PEP-CTERM motif
MRSATRSSYPRSLRRVPIKNYLSFLAALALLYGGEREANAGTVYDAVADFNLTGTNPHSGNPWTYATKSALGGSVTPMAVFGKLGQPSDSNSVYFFNQDFIGPAIGKNTGATTINLGGSPNLLWPNSDLLVAPGGGNNPGSPEFSVVQWTAPATGLYDLSGAFLNLQAANTDLHILANATSMYSSSFDGSESGQDPQSFSATNLSLSEGQTIQFIVGNNGGPNNFNDVVGLSAAISLQSSSVPEPSTLTLFAIGSVVLLGQVWRRRKWVPACTSRADLKELLGQLAR